jgi:protein-S-isoprenylcysteine O-methyltransferase Ste14
MALPALRLSLDGIMAKRLPKDALARLFVHEGGTRRDKTIALLAGIPTLAYFVLLTPTLLKAGWWLLPFGIAIFVAGSVACAHSIVMFSQTPEAEPLTRGLYRLSRNPQAVGASFAVGSWTAVLIGLIWRPWHACPAT